MEPMVIVPLGWLESLLRHATELEAAQEEWDFSEPKPNINVLMRSAALVGYAKSASALIEHGERYEM